MLELLAGMVLVLRPAPTDPSDWPSCGRAGKEEGEGVSPTAVGG